MRRVICGLVSGLIFMAVPARADDVPVTLRGSPESMLRQNGVAKEQGYPFARTPAGMHELEAEGVLVRLEGNEDYGFAEWMNSGLARPEMRTFLERLSAQYHEGCGETLTITSLTRPESRQPGNSHPLSVHPAGIAVDLRVSKRAACRGWLEDTLLSLERQGLLDITREYRPPHYHVALFPEAYTAHVGRLLAAEEAVAEPPVPKIARGSEVLLANAFTTLPETRNSEADAAESAADWWATLVAIPIVLFALATLRRRGKGSGSRE